MSVAEATVERDVRGLDDEHLFEVINGQSVEMPPMSFHATKIASRLVRRAGTFADAAGLGEVVGETLFRLPLAEDSHRNRRPDAAFVSYERWPRDKPESMRDNAWDVVPDLAIEVVSPNDGAEELMDKLGEYFEAGVKQAWVVYPSRKVVQVYDSIHEIRGVAATGILDGGAILPGFQLPLRELFVFPTLEEPQNGDE
jgi:Uma2 family endonuclease